MEALTRWRSRHIEEGIFELKQKPGEGLCLVKNCRKPSERKKLGLCHRCYQSRWRVVNPKRSVFNTLRDHAKQRSIPFSITADYLMGLCDAYAYFDHSAESRGEYPSVDRVNSLRGYEFGNLRIITHSQNIIRNNKERFLPDYVQAILDRKRARAKENPHLVDEMEETDCPF